MKDEKGFALPLFLFLITMIVAIGVGVTFFSNNNKQNPSKKDISKDSIIDEDENSNVIEGEVTIIYKQINSDQVHDNISITTSKHDDSEDAIGIQSSELCKKGQDNCVWLETETNSKRVYKYRFVEPWPNSLKLGSDYDLSLSVRFYNNEELEKSLEKETSAPVIEFVDELKVIKLDQRIKTVNFEITPVFAD
ncbi:hypothetical protein IPM62_03555 [Candidatus Woesebacteria bacterium]|nr:MAG: hypothetical protein IPM62_03555 [Candidatus Woesebacteria bacterium]